MIKYIRLLPKVVIVGLLLFYSCNKPVDKVIVVGNEIWVNDAPYFIKGICYNPVPIGKVNREFNELELDLKLMVEAGINTIRVYRPIEDISVLDRIEKAGLKVIMGIGYNQEGRYDLLSKSYAQYIEKFKEHNAILFWELGNEYNYHPEWFEGNIQNWYATMQQAVNTIHSIDQNHPVATAHGELPDSLALSMGSNIDLWGLNIYRWDNPIALFDQWEKLTDKPFYFSEVGSDSYMTIERDSFTKGENQKAQADAIKNIVSTVFENQNRNNGLTLFSFSDEWWKAGNPDQQDIGGFAPNSTGVPYDGSPNEEYWGIVDIERNKKASFFTLKEQYQRFELNKKSN